MKLVRYNRYAPNTSINNLFDDFFNRGINNFIGSDFLQERPAINVIENEESFVIETAAPGLTKEDFNVSFEDGKLTIAANKEVKEENSEGNYKRREFNYRSFQRVFSLPETVDTDAIKANYEAGILKVELPKLALTEAEKTRQIEIN